VRRTHPVTVAGPRRIHTGLPSSPTDGREYTPDRSARRAPDVRRAELKPRPILPKTLHMVQAILGSFGVVQGGGLIARHVLVSSGDGIRALVDELLERVDATA